MIEVSEERLQRFWEWCGWRRKLSASENPHYWLSPEGQAAADLPDLDLNNLFKWAVPKVLEKVGGERLVVLVNNALCDAIEAKGDVQDYLFLAIERLIELEEERCA